MADRLLRRCTDAAIAVSGSTREFLVRERFVPRERVRLIWNGAPLDEFAPVSRERALAARRALGLPDDAVVFGTISRLSDAEGPHVTCSTRPARCSRRTRRHGC